jgi:hypothetical protein
MSYQIDSASAAAVRVMLQEMELDDEKINGAVNAAWGDIEAQVKRGATALDQTIIFLCLTPEGKFKHEIQDIVLQDDKYQQMWALGGMVAMTRGVPLLLLFASEAWMRSYPESEMPDSRNMIPPSQDPNRQEIVVLTAMTLDARCASVFAPILRANEQEPIQLGPVTWNLLEPDTAPTIALLETEADWPDTSQTDKARNTGSQLLAAFFCGASEMIAFRERIKTDLTEQPASVPTHKLSQARKSVPSTPIIILPPPSSIM